MSPDGAFAFYHPPGDRRMNTKKERPSFCEQALQYASFGWRVFPLHDKDKRPRIANWHEKATTREKQIKRWWATWPNANIAIVCDSERGPVVVDIDAPKKGELPGSDLLKLLRVPKASCVVRTGSGGRHLYFRPPEQGQTIRRTIRPSFNSGRYSLDVLGDKGYVVAPPSIHPTTGKRYTLVRGDLGNLEPLPRAICDLIAKKASTPTAAALPDVIGEGQRDVMLTSLAGTMRRRNASPRAILAALRAENRDRVRPPLPDEQLRKIAGSIGKKAPLDVTLSEPITDVHLGERFASLYCEELRYRPERKQWLVWSGKYWKADAGHEVYRRVERMVREYLKALLSDNEADRVFLGARTKELGRYLYRRKLEDVREHARTNSKFEIGEDRLDADPWLFNVQNGTLNLRTCQLQPHRPTDLLTKLSPATYTANAKCPRWRRFLREIMNDDKGNVSFLQRAIGYTMVGVTTEQVLFFCHGSGANGKSTFLEVIGALFGKHYGVTIDFNMLLRSHHQQESRDKPRLLQMRFVSANETPIGARWNEAVVKDLTGGDTVHARRLYEETFQFAPTHTLWCRGNSQPASHDLSVAFWRRMKLIPFTRQFTGDDRDDGLKDRLIDQELSGILNWALAGCAKWRQATEAKQSNALGEPLSVKRATEEYRTREDIIGEFLAACCRLGADYWCPTAKLFQAFQAWWIDARDSRGNVPSLRTFAEGLRTRGILPKSQRDGAGSDRKARGWQGVCLRRPFA
jgi:putative DNA primase/helicase